MSLLRAVQSLRKIGSSLNLNHYWQIYLIQITCTLGRFVTRKKVSNELVLYHSYFSFTVKSLLFCRNRIQIRYFHQIWSKLQNKKSCKNDFFCYNPDFLLIKKYLHVLQMLIMVIFHNICCKFYSIGSWPYFFYYATNFFLNLHFSYFCWLVVYLKQEKTYLIYSQS